jgi:phosphoglycerate dehydrogenase-like enzyme
MKDAAPVLLVAMPKSDGVEALVSETLPDVPWDYLDSNRSVERGSVRALLVENLRGEFAGFDPRSTPRLEFVQQVWTGLDRFPFGRFPDSVAVAGNVGGFAPYVAEHAIALVLGAARDFHSAQSMVEEGRLRPAPHERTLVDATAVVLGYGAIGQAIAERLAPFRTRVVGLNRTGAPARGAAEMFPASRLADAVRAGSFIFEVRPLTRLTKGTIGAAELEAMPPDAVFVNVGRAGTVDETALYRHLRSHPEFRAAIDVWWAEDPVLGTFTSRHPFAQLPNFYGTPHCADAFPAAKRRAFRMALENLARFFQDGRPRFVADRTEYEGVGSPAEALGPREDAPR